MSPRRTSFTEMAKRSPVHAEQPSGADEHAPEPTGIKPALAAVPAGPASPPTHDAQSAAAAPVAAAETAHAAKAGDSATAVGPQQESAACQQSVPSRPPRPAAPAHLHYSQLIAKEARLRDDQYSDLTTESRRLNRLRKGRGQRITENTLIRVAIDLLLAQRDQLEGADEAELRRSLGVQP